MKLIFPVTPGAGKGLLKTITAPSGEPVVNRTRKELGYNG